MDLSEPKVMAILNITPDSFFSQSRTLAENDIFWAAEKAIADGADILDIGACSTRPAAELVSEAEEWSRLQVALNTIRIHFPEAVLSVDTFRSGIAWKAVQEYGVQIINDISGGEWDDKMFDTIAALQVPYILMHTRGVPATMQTLTDYENVVAEVMNYLETRLNVLRRKGVKDVIIDPGLGFAKTLNQNWEILRNLTYFEELNAPILIGLSRKRMIQEVLACSPEDALNGTALANLIALQNGANIIRVHDVKTAVETVKIYGISNRT